MAQAYRRILLKLGGEALAGAQGYGIDPIRAEEVAAKIKSVKEHEVEIAIVMGAGNLWRGKDGLAHGMDRATADHMGMLARATRISPPTRRLPCAQWRSTPRCSSRPLR